MPPPPRRHFKITRARLNTLARATSWRRKIAAYTAGWTDNFNSVYITEMIQLAEATALAVMSSFEARVVRPLMERNLEPSLWSHPAARMDPRLRARKDLRGIRVGILHSVRRSAAMSERQCRHCTRTTAQQTNDEYANCCCPSLFL